MRIDLWVPTANPFTTPELLAVIGEEAEQRGIGTVWVGEHVVLFDEYASSYPYAEDGRIPAPPGTGPVGAPVHPLLPGRPHLDGAPGHGHGAAPPAQSGVHGQGGVHPRLAVQRPGRPRCRRGMAGRGVRRRQRAVAATGDGGPTSTSRCCGTLWCDETSVLRRGVLLARSVLDVPEAGPAAPSADPHRRARADAALVRVARVGQGWHTFNRRPDQLAEPLGKLDRLLAEQGRSRDDVAITVCPYFQPLDGDIAARVRGGRCRRGLRRCSWPSAPTTSGARSTDCSRSSTAPQHPDRGASRGQEWSGSAAHRHRQRLHPPQHDIGLVSHLIDGEGQIRSAIDQRGERHLGLHAGQRCAEAVVDPEPEPEVVVRIP